MRVAGICEEKSHGFYRGASCPKCGVREKESIMVNVFKDGDVEVGANERMHIGSKRDQREALKRHGIAPLEECKDRVKDGLKKQRKEYALSESQKRLNYEIRSNSRDGRVAPAMFERHPAFIKAYHSKRRKDHG